MLLDVPGRSKILIHAGNFPRDTEGCILVGKDFKDLNGDNVMDVSTSRVALDEILELVNKSFEIELEIKDGIDNV